MYIGIIIVSSSEILGKGSGLSRTRPRLNDIYIYIYIYIYMYVCMYVCIYIYIYIWAPSQLRV